MRPQIPNPERAVRPRPALDDEDGNEGFEVCIRIPLWEGVGVHEVISLLGDLHTSLINTFAVEENRGIYSGEVRPIIRHTEGYHAVMPYLLTGHWMDEEILDAFNQVFAVADQMYHYSHSIPDGMPIAENDSPTSELGTAAAEPETDRQRSDKKDQE